MKMLIARSILFYVIFLGLSYANSLKNTVPSNQQIAMEAYLDEVLVNAGFSDATRKYLEENARPQLLKIKPEEQKEKMRLLKRNLYIFLNNMSDKYQTSTKSELINKQFSIADQHDKPWDYILSKEVLSIFKSNHIFDELTIEDLQNTNMKFCPIWPFC